jgi:hypothetical protein
LHFANLYSVQIQFGNKQATTTSLGVSMLALGEDIRQALMFFMILSHTHLGHLMKLQQIGLLLFQCLIQFQRMLFVSGTKVEKNGM